MSTEDLPPNAVANLVTTLVNNDVQAVDVATGASNNTFNTFGQNLSSQFHLNAAAVGHDLDGISGEKSNSGYSSSDDDEYDGDQVSIDDDESVHSMQSGDQIIYSNDEEVADQSLNSSGQHQALPGYSKPRLVGTGTQVPIARTPRASDLPSPRDLSYRSSNFDLTPLTALSHQPSGVSEVSPEKSSSVTIVDATRAVPLRRRPSRPETIQVRKPSAEATSRGLQSDRRKGQLPTTIVKVRIPNGTIVKVRRTIRTPTVELEDKLKTTSPTAKLVPHNTEVFSTLASIKKTRTPNFSHPSKPIVRIEEMETTESESSEESRKQKNTEPALLLRRTKRAGQLVTWIIMVSFPILFIVVGILNTIITDKPAGSSFGIGVSQANKFAVSLWPIVFAAVAAQVLRMIASFKVESGIRLMVLEQLINSHSVGSVIKQPFLFQRFNFISIALFAFWSLSPLAGQALLRMSFISPRGAINDGSLQYVNTTRHPIAFNQNPANSAYTSIIDAIFGSSIFAPLTIQQAPMDSWGNIKIPVFSDLEATDSNNWAEVGTNPTYSALVGIPVANLSSSGSNSSFSLQSAYFTFTCPALTNTTLEQVNLTTRAANQTLISSPTSMFYTALMLPDEGSKSISIASAMPGNTFAYTTCTFDQMFVESHILCAGTSCRVDKMRTAPATALENPIGRLEYVNWITQFTKFGATSGSGAYSPVQFFINDPTTAGSHDIFAGPNLLQTPTDVFNQNLAILLNTLWISGISPTDMTGKVSSDQLVIAEGEEPILLSTNNTITSTELVYHTSWAWLSVLFASSGILLLGAVIGAICDSRTVGPDILGYASSMAHRNKYMRDLGDKTPRNGTMNSTMGGPERVRLLGDLKVMLQDVSPDDEVGNIALGTVENGGQKLKYGRLYK